MNVWAALAWTVALARTRSMPLNALVRTDSQALVVNRVGIVYNGRLKHPLLVIMTQVFLAFTVSCLRNEWSQCLICDIPVINPCDSSPCQNGATCFNNLGLADCTPCPSGYHGYFCESGIPQTALASFTAWFRVVRSPSFDCLVRDFAEPHLLFASCRGRWMFQQPLSQWRRLQRRPSSVHVRLPIWICWRQMRNQ